MMEEHTIMVKKMGGYKSQLSDDLPGDYIGTSQTT